MDKRQGWCETNVLPAFDSEEGDEGRKVESMRSRKGGQNFSIERILGRVRGGQEADERLADQEEYDGQEQELEEGDEDEVEEEDNRDEGITNQEYQLKKEHAHIDHLLGLSSKGSPDQPYPTSIGRVQPILPRPPPLVPPPPTSTVAPSLFPRASPFSQDPFLLTPLQSQRYSFIAVV